MRSILKYTLTLFLIASLYTGAKAQLSQARIADIANIKVERFQNILDLTTAQSAQLRQETIKLMIAHSTVAGNKNVIGTINKNLDTYYANLTTLVPQQLATLKLMDSMERQSRRESYADLMKAYGQSSDFAVEVATYNWNVAMPILVSYRKDLDKFITPEDQATLANLRSNMVTKYNFIVSARANKPSAQTEVVISSILDEVISDISDSPLPKLISKYDANIIDIRKELQKHEIQINMDIKNIYDKHMLDNHKSQTTEQKELLAMLGITNLLRDSFFLILDGDSRTASFKMNALHLMTTELEVNSQF